MLKAAGVPFVFHQNGIILAQLAVNLPSAIKLTVMAFQGVNRKLEAVAGLLGASRFQQFRTIILPLCKNTMISSFILIWSRALGEFGATLMLVGVTRMKTETLPGNIYLNVSTNQIDGALASAFLLLILAALSLFISHCVTRTDWRQQRYERKIWCGYKMPLLEKQVRGKHCFWKALQDFMIWNQDLFCCMIELWRRILCRNGN